MQIALTKKLADAIGMKGLPEAREDNPLFTWTANWTKVWENRKSEEMLVLVNNATRFCIAVYQVKKKDLKNVSEMIPTAIINSLLAMNFKPEAIEEYMQIAGEVEFVKNRSRQAATWVTQAGLYSAIQIAHEYNGIPKMFNDTVGTSTNYLIVNSSDQLNGAFIPYEKFRDALSALTGRSAI